VEYQTGCAAIHHQRTDGCVVEGLFPSGPEESERGDQEYGRNYRNDLNEHEERISTKVAGMPP